MGLFVLTGFGLLITSPALAGYSYNPGGSKVSFLLVAMAVGYWVLTLSVKQGKPLDKLGRILGIFILIVSFVGLICISAVRVCQWRGSCALSGSSSAAKASPCCVFGGNKPAPSDASQ